MRTLVSSPRPLSAPKAIRVQVDPRGKPIAVGGVRVETVRRDWMHRFAWWTDEPLLRRYYEVITVTGRRVVVFRDMLTDGWFSQQA
jgi:hypothetical protein